MQETVQYKSQLFESYVTDSQTKTLFCSFYAWFKLKNEFEVVMYVIFSK